MSLQDIETENKNRIIEGLKNTLRKQHNQLQEAKKALTIIADDTNENSTYWYCVDTIRELDK